MITTLILKDGTKPVFYNAVPSIEPECGEIIMIDENGYNISNVYFFEDIVRIEVEL